MATATSLSVDKGVPIPTASAREGVNMSLLKSLGQGDSVWWKDADAKKATRFYRVAQKLNFKIVIRKVGGDDPKGKGVRMWKVGVGNGAAAPDDPIYAAAKAAEKKAAKKGKAKPKTVAKKKPAAKAKRKPKSRVAVPA